MTAFLALNLVLAVVVVAALLGLLSWAIISSRGDQPVETDVRQPARRPYGARPHTPHPHWPDGHRAQQGAPEPVAE